MSIYFFLLLVVLAFSTSVILEKKSLKSGKKMTDHPDLVTAATHFIFTKTLSNEVSMQVEGAQPLYFLSIHII